MQHPLKSTGEATKIVDSDVLKKLRHVIQNTDKPSWMAPVPHNFGAAAAGTPKADEWRSVFTIYLPITLILLFGQLDSSKQQRDVLDHTMLLVCAVLLACKRTMTSRRIERYRENLRAYIRLLPLLYPDLSCESIHHMAFHIYDFLKLFGPVHSWWTFPFERLIGQLQRVPTNHRFGQLEHTIHRAFLRAANLRRWLSRPNCPNVIRQCKVLFDKLYGEKADGNAHLQEISLADDNPPTSVPTPDDLRALINRSRVILQARYRADGVIYARAQTHVGNSLIMYYPDGDRSLPPIPGSIQYIYSIDGRLRFAVRRYHTPTLSYSDPFRHYADFPARIWATDKMDQLEAVEVGWVLSHFAQYRVSDTDVVVLALSQVRFNA